MNKFLPADYERPIVSGNYMKLVEGPNKFRILSPALTGYEYWTINNKPTRAKERFTMTPKDARLDDSDNFKQKFFWAFVVWNYTDSKLQILEITQSTIQEQIEGFIMNEDWGEPDGYDMTIRRTGKDLDTTYTIQPSPHKELDAEIKQAYEESKIHLEALYSSQDPFNYVEGAE